MSRVRPLERQDLPAVATLFELVFRSATPHPPSGLASYFERLLFDQPFFDPELPSLVYDEPGEGIIGFIASHPRPFVCDERSLRMASTGPLVAHPNVRSRGVGALLMRSYLAGPQDFTTTDSAAADMIRAMWVGLGGVANAMASVAWTRVLAPASFTADRLATRRGRSGAPGARLWTALDGLAGRPLRPPRPRASSEPLTAAMLSEALSQLPRRFPLRASYDTASLTWLLREMETVSVVRGPLVRRLVQDARGKVAGWYVVYLRPGDICQVVQIVGKNVELVLDELFCHAAEQGATAVRGRVDPYLYPLLRTRRCMFRPTTWVLLHARDPALIGTILSGQGLVTRMDSEWWMALRQLDAATLARQEHVQPAL